MFKFIFLMLFSINAVASSCVVLLYHHFSNSTPKSTSISPELFEKHLLYLQKNNFKVLKLSSMLEQLKTQTLPNKCVVLTADDAYNSIAKNAYPLLKKYDMPMAVFVATKGVDDKYNALMSWQVMRDIQGENIEFYNHTKTHYHLLDLDAEQVKNEINFAQLRLNKELKIKDKILAYPYGEASLAIFEQMQNLDFISFGQQSGVVSNNSDLQNLPRFPMAANFAKMSSFKTKINTLPMPIIEKRINVIIKNNPPTLELNFKKSLTKHQKNNFNCFASGGVDIIWKNNKTALIKAQNKLTYRRSKYNCTMPSGQKNRYYWHSVQWINPKVAE